MSNRMLSALVVSVIGLAMMVFGFYYASEVVVKCDGKVMQSGDTCKKRKHSRRTYEEQRDLDHTMGWVALGVGSLVTMVASGSGSGPTAGPPMRRRATRHRVGR